MSYKKLIILYGSQTGMAQDVAERLWREGKCYGFHGPVLPMDEYDIQNLINEPLVLFVCSTTGQGDQPDNMKNFWSFLLRKSLPSNSLAAVKFAVLGLGDSSYVKFNFCAKKLYKRLLQLGASSLIEPGYADEQHDLGIDAVVDVWIKKLWETLLSSYPSVDAPSLVMKRKLFPPRWSVKVTTNQHANEDQFRNRDLHEKNSAFLTCLTNQRVTSMDHFQDTRLIKFTSENLCYEPGSVLMVRPKNSSEAISQFFNLFVDRENEIHENVILSITELDTHMPVPHSLQKSLTLRSLVEYYWDLNMVPRRYTFELLSHFTDNELEREKLTEFSTPSGQDELYTYCNRPKRTILEVLADFPHATKKLPLKYFLEIFQPIRSRAYSIASSPTCHDGEIHILVAVVKYKTNLKIPRIGLCSNWLASLKSNDKVAAQVKKASFNFEKAKGGPIIMVGPGTGIAPFRSFVYEDWKSGTSHRHFIFFGCRGKQTDFYFEEEWIKLKNDDKIDLFVAFSRDTSQKVYVQHVITKNQNLVGKLLAETDAAIFVAGNSKNMPQAVREAFILAFAKYKGIEEEEAEKTFVRMDRNGRYQTETWS